MRNAGDALTETETRVTAAPPRVTPLPQVFAGFGRPRALPNCTALTWKPQWSACLRETRFIPRAFFKDSHVRFRQTIGGGPHFPSLSSGEAPFPEELAHAALVSLAGHVSAVDRAGRDHQQTRSPPEAVAAPTSKTQVAGLDDSWKVTECGICGSHPRAKGTTGYTSLFCRTPRGALEAPSSAFTF